MSDAVTHSIHLNSDVQAALSATRHAHTEAAGPRAVHMATLLQRRGKPI